MALQQLEDNVVLGHHDAGHWDEVDGWFLGSIHTTANTIRSGLPVDQDSAGYRPGGPSNLLMLAALNRSWCMAIAPSIPGPNAEELPKMPFQSAMICLKPLAFPPVAMLIQPYSTGESRHRAWMWRRSARRRKSPKRARAALLIDGPTSVYDAAPIASVGAQKATRTALLAARPLCSCFQDLNTGNTTYKAVKRSANVVSVGPMLQGLRKTVNDLSRGARWTILSTPSP